MGRLDGKVAVVTGGANGIGRACALRFAEEGADIVVGDVLDAAQTIAAVSATGHRGVARRSDASIADDNEALMQAALDEFGTLDVVLTAAGVSHASYRSGESSQSAEATAVLALQGLPQQFAELTTAEWRGVLDVNLDGTFYALRAAARRMIEARRGGSMITISSVAAKHPEMGPTPYTVSKAGVWMLTKQAARHLGPAGIRVNSIGPGYIHTNMSAGLKGMPGGIDRISASLPLGRIGLPLDVANAALFLASDESSYFTGEILHPDGGFVTD